MKGQGDSPTRSIVNDGDSPQQSCGLPGVGYLANPISGNNGHMQLLHLQHYLLITQLAQDKAPMPDQSVSTYTVQVDSDDSCSCQKAILPL